MQLRFFTIPLSDAETDLHTEYEEYNQLALAITTADFPKIAQLVQAGSTKKDLDKIPDHVLSVYERRRAAIWIDLASTIPLKSNHISTPNQKDNPLEQLQTQLAPKSINGKRVKPKRQSIFPKLPETFSINSNKSPALVVCSYDTIMSQRGRP